MLIISFLGKQIQAQNMQHAQRTAFPGSVTPNVTGSRTMCMEASAKRTWLCMATGQKRVYSPKKTIGKRNNRPKPAVPIGGSNCLFDLEAGFIMSDPSNGSPKFDRTFFLATFAG